jgi:hypothetical protein
MGLPLCGRTLPNVPWLLMGFVLPTARVEGAGDRRRGGLVVRGDLNPKSRAFSPILRLNTQVGEKSPVRGFHALMVAATPRPVSSGLADCGAGAGCAGAATDVTAARMAKSAGVPPVSLGSRRAAL